MKTTMNHRTVRFGRSGDPNCPVALFIDELFIQKFGTFYEAEAAAKEITSRYPGKEEGDNHEQ